MIYLLWVHRRRFSCLVFMLLSASDVQCNDGKSFLICMPFTTGNRNRQSSGRLYIISLARTYNRVEIISIWVEKNILQNKLYAPGEATETPYLRPEFTADWVQVPTVSIEATHLINVQVNVHDNSDALKLKNGFFIAHAIETWGKQYFVANYEQTAYIIILAKEEVTVEITLRYTSLPYPTAEGLHPHTNGTFKEPGDQSNRDYHDKLKFSKAINQQGAFQMVRNTNDNRSFSGTQLSSTTKTFAVIAGNREMKSPTDAEYSDFTVEWMPPVHLLGKVFILCRTPTYPSGHSEDVVVTSTKEGATNISIAYMNRNTKKVNHTSLPEISSSARFSLFFSVTLESCCAIIANGAARITSNKDILVAQYMRSYHAFGNNKLTGGPSMSVIPPTRIFKSWYIVRIPVMNETHYFVQNWLVAVSESITRYDINLDLGFFTATTKSKSFTNLDIHVQQWHLMKTEGKVVPIWLNGQDCNKRFGAYIISHYQNSGIFSYLGFRPVSVDVETSTMGYQCVTTVPVIDDLIDNDCDGRVDEERVPSENDDADKDGLRQEDTCSEYGSDGAWSEWSPWNECDETKCKIFRSRFCNNPPPSYLGEECDTGQKRRNQTEDMLIETNCSRTSPLGITCPFDCPYNHYGHYCIECPNTCQGCDKIDGTCIDCENDTAQDTSPLCHQECPRCTYGQNCAENCLGRCGGVCCDPVFGRCNDDEGSATSDNFTLDSNGSTNATGDKSIIDSPIEGNGIQNEGNKTSGFTTMQIAEGLTFVVFVCGVAGAVALYMCKEKKEEHDNSTSVQSEEDISDVQTTGSLTSISSNTSRETKV